MRCLLISCLALCGAFALAPCAEAAQIGRSIADLSTATPDPSHSLGAAGEGVADCLLIDFPVTEAGTITQIAIREDVDTGTLGATDERSEGFNLLVLRPGESDPNDYTIVGLAPILDDPEGIPCQHAENAVTGTPDPTYSNVTIYDVSSFGLLVQPGDFIGRWGNHGFSPVPFEATSTGQLQEWRELGPWNYPFFDVHGDIEVGDVWEDFAGSEPGANGRTYLYNVTTGVVPEPSLWSLLVIGGVCLVFIRKKKKH